MLWFVYNQGQTTYTHTPTGLPQNALVVSRRQAGNPLLKHIRNVRWSWGDIVPDYLTGASGCALFLSLRCETGGGRTCNVQRGGVHCQCQKTYISFGLPFAMVLVGCS